MALTQTSPIINSPAFEPIFDHQISLQTLKAELELAQREKEQALQRAAAAEARAMQEGCKVRHLSQERTQLMLQLSETESNLAERMQGAERSLADGLKSMDASLKSTQAERDELAWELAESKRVQQQNSATSERKQIVEDLRMLKGDAENCMEQRLTVAEQAMAARLHGLDAKVARAQESQSAGNGQPGNQELLSKINSLVQEKDAVSSRLKDALTKIEEMQRTMEEERATFWEELDLMRGDRDARERSALACPERTHISVSAPQIAVSGPAPATWTPAPHATMLSASSTAADSAASFSTCSSRPGSHTVTPGLINQNAFSLLRPAVPRGGFYP